MGTALWWFGAALLVSLMTTPLIRSLALRHGRVAVPRETRWHRKETALLGGAAIFSSTAAVWAAGSALMGWRLYGGPLLPLMLASAGIFALGLMDDLQNLSPQHKLAGEVVLASVVLFLGHRLAWTPSPTVNLVLSLIWVVGITNAFNLLDNMDGLSAGIAIIAGGFLFVHLAAGPIPPSQEPRLLLLAAFLGAVLGFWVYNFNPASIFMGDAGSLFLGFLLATLTMPKGLDETASEGYLHLVFVMAVPVFILFIPILDTAFVSLMRKIFRRRLSQGGRDHSSHRLVAIGFSEKKAVIILYGFAAVSGLIALALPRLGLGPGLILVVVYLLFILFFWIYLAKVKVYPESSVWETGEGKVTPLLIEITYRRRLLELILDLVLITVAYYSAYLLRFEGDPGPNFPFFLHSLPILIGCQVFCFYLFGIYRGVWEATSLPDLMGYLKAVSTATVLTILFLLFLYRFTSFSRAVFVIYWFLMLGLTSLSRLSFRLFDEGIKKGNPGGRPTLIYGAGVGGQMALKEIETNRALNLDPVGFLDDNPRLHRSKVRGYPVLGGIKDLDRILERHPVQEIVVSFKENAEERQREIRHLCREQGHDVSVRRLTVTLQ